MIIAGHAGTGKTYFSKNVYDSVDFVCMPYKYYLPDGFIAGEELSCLTKPTDGDAFIGGYSITKQPKQVKCLIGVSPQETAVAPFG